MWSNFYTIKGYTKGHKQAVRAFNIDAIHNKPVGLAEGLSYRLNLIYGVMIENKNGISYNGTIKIKKQVIEMNAGIIAGQMLVLFFMMLAGFIAFKAHIVSQAGSKSLSSVIINIFNPCLIISGVLNKKITYSPRMVERTWFWWPCFFWCSLS